MTLDKVLTMIRKACDRAGGQSAWAEKIGTTAQKVSDVLARRREPGPKLLSALGLERLPTEYRRIAANPPKRKGK